MKGIAYQERNIQEDKSAVDELQKLGYMTTPVVVINGEVIVGFDKVKLEIALSKE